LVLIFVFVVPVTGSTVVFLVVVVLFVMSSLSVVVVVDEPSGTFGSVVVTEVELVVGEAVVSSVGSSVGTDVVVVVVWDWAKAATGSKAVAAAAIMKLRISSLLLERIA